MSAINRILRTDFELSSFDLEDVDGGANGQAQATIIISYNEIDHVDKAVDTDSIVAATKAIIQAINKVLATKKS